jgi:hypothetical protein
MRVWSTKVKGSDDLPSTSGFVGCVETVCAFLLLRIELQKQVLGTVQRLWVEVDSLLCGFSDQMLEHEPQSWKIPDDSIDALEVPSSKGNELPTGAHKSRKR